MELDELHVHQFSAGLIRECVAVTSTFPTVARDFVGTAGPAGCKNDRSRAEHLEPSAFTLVPHDSRRASAARQQPDDGEFHVDVDAAVHAVILQRADHFETGAIPDMRKPGISVATEITLKNSAIRRAIED